MLKRQVLFRRDQVYRIGLHGHAVFRLQNLHIGMLSQNIGHEAFIIRRKVLHNNKA